MAETQETPVNINWTDVEAVIRSNTHNLTTLSDSLGLSKEDTRKYLVEHWPTQIEFKRGRKGGIRFKE